MAAMEIREKNNSLRMNLLNLFILQVLSINEAFNLSCPSQAHWDLRAKSMCNPPRNYTCLYNVTFQVNVYRDKCSRPRLLAPGYKYVFQPNLNRALCNENRFQPFIFDTVGYSDCTFLKSLCNNEGQTVYAPGNTTSDRTCTCNTDEGLNFVKNPVHQCYCNPSIEDCSCYISDDKNNKTTGPKDFKCHGEVMISPRNLGVKPNNKSQALKLGVFDNYKYNIASPLNTNRTTAAVIVIMLVSSYTLVAVLICNLRLIQVSILLRIQDHWNDIKSGKDEVDTLKDREDPVPSHKREQMKRTVDGWKLKDEKFICTRAYNDVFEKICSKSCVTVIGNGGSGKSAIVRHAALSLWQDKGFEITLVSNPTEFKDYYKPARKTLFVLDDVCGKFTANKFLIESWCLILDFVNLVMEDDSCKILLSCRLQVYKEPIFSRLKPFTSCACNIISEELSLTIEEKNQFVKTYLNSENIKIDTISRKNDMFPLLCDLYAKDKNIIDFVKYLNMPYDVYSNELNELKINGKYKFCSLFICIIYNNKLEEKDFLPFSREFENMVGEICYHCGLHKKILPTKIRDELDTLDNTYITKNHGFYEIYHDILFDFLALYFGQNLTQCFIKHADSGLIRDRFLLGKDTELSIENIIQLEETFLKPYIDRMKLDWKNGKVSDVFYNINMRNPTFRVKFLNSLKEIDKEDATELANMKDVFREDFASGNTPLIISSVDGHVDLLKWLIDNGANVNDQRKDGATALLMGCEKNYVDVVNILLEKDADVNLCTEDGVSPLGTACYFNGNLQIICQLLKKKANVNMHRFKKNNMTSLFMACDKKYLPAAKELLIHGADHGICLHNGKSVLLSACQNGFTDIVRLLLQYKANPNVEMEDGDTPLFSAAGIGHTKIVEMLLENGADLNKSLNSSTIIEKTLEGKSKSLKSEKMSWYDAAKAFGSKETKTYIESKSHDDIFDAFTGSSPLHVACFMGHVEITKLLSKRLVCVDIRKKDDTTPLFYACEIGHLEITRVLMGKGANPNICRGNQSSPLSIAKLNGYSDVMSLLSSYG